MYDFRLQVFERGSPCRCQSHACDGFDIALFEENERERGVFDDSRTYLRSACMASVYPSSTTTTSPSDFRERISFNDDIFS